MSIENIAHELRIHARLLESKAENQGKNKKIDFIIGCLLALACNRSFEEGYNGFVSLYPKTKLIKHYQSRYDFQQMGREMAVWGQVAKDIIDKYL